MYNRLGERIAKRDQNGTIHTYEYDDLGRLLHDRITTLASGVDGTVRRISTVYDVVGNVKSVTSYDNATVGSGTVLNQVRYEYDVNGLLSKDFSNPNGEAIGVFTPFTGYTYDTTKTGDVFTKSLRLKSMTYPSGKTLTYDYDAIGNVTAIKEDTQTLVSYQHSGGGNVMKTTYPQPGLTLDYDNGGLDCFNRVVDHAWTKDATNVVRIEHLYDRAGNRTIRRDRVSLANTETYKYDQVNQIKSLQRVFQFHVELWDYDHTGNWTQYKRTGVAENRTHNAANEIQGIADHDQNGNMTVMPGMKAKYDAWNRLVEVFDSLDVLIATYGYNGLNQRVRKTVGSVVTTSFFNADWQELESIASGQTTVNIWGQRYIDDLVLREKAGEPFYSLADPNWNVVAVTDDSGTVQERMKYDAFGKVTWMTAAFATKANSDLAWNRTFTGQVLDAETGIMLYRNRYYLTHFGRFGNRDPIGYDAGDENLYRYVLNRSITSFDSFGLQNAGYAAYSYPVHKPPKPTSPLILRLPPDKIAKSCDANEDLVEKLVP